MLQDLPMMLCVVLKERYWLKVPVFSFCFVLAKKLAFHSLQNSASGCSIHLTNFCVIDGERFDFYLVFSKLHNLLKITVSNNRFRKNKTSSRTN